MPVYNTVPNGNGHTDIGFSETDRRENLKMKKRLQRILSILCMMVLVTGCVSLPAMAEETKAETVRIITVEWEDEDDYDALRPDHVDMKIGTTPVTLKADEQWTAEVAAPADASWTLADVEGYMRRASADDDMKVVTYTHTVERKDVKGSVSWSDSDDAAGIRPDSVQVRLLADGAPYGASRAASAKNGWSVTWEDAPVYQKGGKTAVTYTVEEIAPEGYTVSVQGLTATNTIQTGHLVVKARTSAA